MRRLLGIVVVISWIHTAALAGALRFVTYNVENYAEVNRMTAAGYREDYPKPEEAKAALRSVLRQLDADVVALQEMGTQAHLEELRRDLAAAGLKYDYHAWLEASDKDRHLAVLSRLPLEKVRLHDDLRFRAGDTTEAVKRGLLEVTVGTGAARLSVFIVHLKSRLSDDAEDPLSARRRGKEAEAIRERILERCADERLTHYVIAGDFNDAPRSRPVRALAKKGDRTIARPLDLADDRGHRWTHRYAREGVYSTVDYVMVSEALEACVVKAESRIHQSPEVGPASDHRPLLVTFLLK